MSRTSTTVQVGKRKLEISNLEKVLFPEDQIVKAELIEYYLKIAPTILFHIKGRPLSLVRYPDGIYGEKFFQKNRPDWTPEWIEHVSLGEEETTDYIIATEEASLVWLANLACIELHQMHCRKPHFDKPDYMVFDLDPPEGCAFEHVVEVALALREHVENYGYHAFVKTTGRKGLHVLLPVEPNWDFHTVFEAAQDMAKAFEKKHAKSTTLQIRKESRQGKILLDIYRNRQYQSIVSPYSVRGERGAPVSMPLPWEALEKLKEPARWNIRTAVEHILSEGDAWEGMGAYAVPLHTQRKSIKKKAAAIQRSKYSKTPDVLEEYARKRQFEKTPEPAPEIVAGEGNAFVIHRHHASHLHYDLRLEKEGTLKSWAVPKGMPPRPGVKRLAVAVEDHPLEYLDFEGEIPKGEYGGGRMWIFARGKYEITREKKNGFYVRFQSPELSGEFRMYQTRANEWLLERVDTPQIDWLHAPIEPMLAESRNQPPTSEEYIFEVKWDGIRTLISLDDGEITLRTRKQQDITRQFPELQVPEAFRAACGLFDAEIVCLDDDGRPNFSRVIHRMQQRSEGAIERARAKNPAVCYVFDCLYLDGRSIIHEPLYRRREWLEDVIRKETPYRISEFVTEGRELFEAARKMGLEGIMAKQRTSKYLPGKRSPAWLKIKTRQTMECLIIGYTRGKGDRQPYFGALHLGIFNDKGNLKYLGKVGTGFDEKTLKEIYNQVKRIKVTRRLIKEKPVDDAKTVWIEPVLPCEVQYSSITENGTLREPVFLRLRPDLMRKD